MITQGDWKIANVDHREINANGIGICEIYYGESAFVPDKEEAIDNARLIAAAPDLLAVCKEAIKDLERCKDVCLEPDKIVCITDRGMYRIKSVIAEIQNK